MRYLILTLLLIPLRGTALPLLNGSFYHTAPFTATGPVTTLRFTDTSGPNSISDLYIDDVKLTPIRYPVLVPPWFQTQETTVVARTGIEPVTQGFSVLCSTN